MRVTTVQASHTYGVLDPHMAERRDTKFVGGSLSDGANIVMLPQGGYVDRGGTTDFGRVRRKLTAISVTSGMLTLPNGGTAADLLDAATDVTTSAASGTRFVLFEVDLGAATTVHMIDVRKVLIATTGASGALVAEWWDGAAWQPFGAAAALDVGALTKRIASGAPGDAGVSAQKFRVAVDATTAAGAVTLRGLALWAESATLSDAIARGYSPEEGTAHQLVFTENNLDVFEAGVWQASAYVPIAEAILREVKLEAKYDTVLAFHQDLAPQKIFRDGASTEWACDAVEFDHIPRYDYGAVYTNGVTEVQQIELYSFGTGDQFDLTLEGQTTAAITHDATGSVTAASIKAALEGLSAVDSGLTVDAVSATEFTVTFTGGNNANRDWLLMSSTALNAGGYVRVRTITDGEAGGEDIISDARGWPAVGRFAQQRLIMAGLKSRQNAVLASVTGSPYDLNTAVDTSLAAFSYDIEGPENNAIRDIVVSRTLIFLGSRQTAFLVSTVLSASDAPQFGLSDAPGAKRIVPPVSSDNAIFYIQQGGTTLRLLSYTELEQNYVAENASVLSAFLIRDPVDMARRRATSGIDADLIAMVNGDDGTMTVLTVLRTQEVSGFAPWTTDGAFKSVTVDLNNDIWLLAERQVDGVSEIRLERLDPDDLLDEAATLTLSPASATLTGLSRFNGRDVWVKADDQVFGPYTVSGGTLTLPQTVASARVGSWAAPFATDQGISLEEQTQNRMARLKRVNRAVVSVVDTTSLAVQANDGAVADVPLWDNDDVSLDEGPLARPFTGKAEAEGMHGFTEYGKLTVTQLYPGKLGVRSVTKNVAA